jgi:hypothetical protein
MQNDEVVLIWQFFFTRQIKTITNICRSTLCDLLLFVGPSLEGVPYNISPLWSLCDPFRSKVVINTRYFVVLGRSELGDVPQRAGYELRTETGQSSYDSF